MKSFNVLTDPWIPVIGLSGTHETLGIRETLRRAPELKEISIVSPTEEFSVYRFLSVLLMDALRPMTVSDIHEITSRNAFDLKKIASYFDLCAETGLSFDIFDAKRPFMQPTYNKKWDKEPESVTRIDFAFPSGNNHVHFEHRNPSTVSYPFAEAFRKMLACHVFMTQGGAGYSPGINAAPPYYAIVNRENLFLTLCTMLVPLNDYIPNVSPCPAISKMDGIEPKKIRGAVDEATGEVDSVCFFQAMLFPVRRIILIPDKDADTVTNVYFNRGFKYGGGESWTDPNVSYRWSAPDKDGNRKRFTFKPDLDVSVWRNYAEMIRDEGRPAILSRYMEIDPHWTVASVTLYGMQTDQAKCCNLLRCNIDIPRNILGTAEKVAFITECLDYSERLSRRLEFALRVALQNEKPDISPKDAKKANASVKTAVNLFFSGCESVFLNRISEMDNFREENKEDELKQWKKDCFSVAKKVYYSAAGNIHASGRTLKNIAEGQRILYGLNRPKKEE